MTPLEQFRSRRELWIRCLTGDDRNSVSGQLESLLWFAGAFRVVNEARRLSPPAEGGGVQLNGLMHELLDHGFFVSQMSAVRRLLDQSPIDHPKRGVFSLVSLLADLAKHSNLISRSHIFAAEDLAYDYRALEVEHEAYIRARIVAGEQAYGVPRRLDWRRSERRHQQIDELANVTADKRSESDVVNSSVYDVLSRRLDVDKFIAHAATPESRSIVDADTTAITLGHLWEAIRTIVQISNFVSVYIFGGPNFGFLPIPQSDIFCYLDRPLTDRLSIPMLEEVWDGFDKELHAWALWGIEQFRLERAIPDNPRTDG